MAAAVKLFDIDAIGKGVSSDGTAPAGLARPKPAECSSPVAETKP
jgi:hypothetical protein